MTARTSTPREGATREGAMSRCQSLTSEPADIHQAPAWSSRSLPCVSAGRSSTSVKQNRQIFASAEIALSQYLQIFVSFNAVALRLKLNRSKSVAWTITPIDTKVIGRTANSSIGRMRTARLERNMISNASKRARTAQPPTARQEHLRNFGVPKIKFTRAPPSVDRPTWCGNDSRAAVSRAEVSQQQPLT